MYKIRDWLYISGFTAACDARWLRHKGIGSLLSLCKPIEHANITSLYVPVHDKAVLSDASLEKAMDFVREQVALDKPVLIVCSAGTNASVIMAIAALKEIEGLSMRDAFFDVREKNSEAMPEQTLWEDLRRHYGESTLFWDVWQEMMTAEQKTPAASA